MLGPMIAALLANLFIIIIFSASRIFFFHFLSKQFVLPPLLIYFTLIYIDKAFIIEFID